MLGAAAAAGLLVAGCGLVLAHDPQDDPRVAWGAGASVAPFDRHLYPNDAPAVSETLDQNEERSRG